MRRTCNLNRGGLGKLRGRTLTQGNESKSLGADGHVVRVEGGAQHEQQGALGLAAADDGFAAVGGGDDDSGAGVGWERNDLKDREGRGEGR